MSEATKKVGMASYGLRTAGKGWRGKEGKDSEERTARRGWRGKEGKDSEEKKERIARKGQ